MGEEELHIVRRDLVNRENMHYVNDLPEAVDYISSLVAVIDGSLAVNGQADIAPQQNQV